MSCCILVLCDCVVACHTVFHCYFLLLALSCVVLLGIFVFCIIFVFYFISVVVCVLVTFCFEFLVDLGIVRTMLPLLFCRSFVIAYPASFRFFTCKSWFFFFCLSSDLVAV